MSGIKGTGFKTLDEGGPRLPYDDIIRDAIMTAIWNGDMSYWDAAQGSAGHRALKRDFTPNEIYKWVNENPGEIDKRTGRPHTDFFHKSYSQNAKHYIGLLKAIVIGRKRVLDKYKEADEAKQSEIDALEQKFKLPDDVREWLKTQELTESDKNLFNLIESADSSSGSSAGSSADAEATTTDASADAGGRRRRKTSFRRRRMSRYRSSKSKSKSKKSRKSRKCVR
jgi:hypothetical protein